MYSVHFDADRWGHNIRELSDDGIGIEIAQARLGQPITDLQVQTVAYILLEEVFPVHPHLTSANVILLEHHETAPGKRDGKSDVDPSRPGVLAERVRGALLAMEAL